MRIREATPEDWPLIWPYMRRILAAGDTYCLPVDFAEDEARRFWHPAPPGRTFVADVEGSLPGTAMSAPNQPGPGAHVGNAAFMVDPDHGGKGVGRALGEHVVEHARRDGFRAMQFNSVVETNTGALALWRSLGFDVIATVPEGFRHPTQGYVGLNIMYRRLV